MSSKEQSQLVLSLDFELIWGIFEGGGLAEDYFRKTRQSVPDVLGLFCKYEIAATWACVGMLFHSDWAGWKSALPRILPNYRKKNVCSYGFANGSLDFSADSFFAKDLINKIQETDRQEVATHTYSHYYCLEKGQNEQQFDADLKAARKIANQMGIQLQSLVFPRN